jgi:hypothetical protein
LLLTSSAFSRCDRNKRWATVRYAPDWRGCRRRKVIGTLCVRGTDPDTRPGVRTLLTSAARDRRPTDGWLLCCGSSYAARVLGLPPPGADRAEDRRSSVVDRVYATVRPDYRCGNRLGTPTPRRNGLHRNRIQGFNTRSSAMMGTGLDVGSVGGTRSRTVREMQSRQARLSTGLLFLERKGLSSVQPYRNRQPW